MAKFRALRAMIGSALESLEMTHLLDKIHFIGLTPWRQFTAFDAHSNILRNVTAVASAQLTGMEVIQSLPWDLLIEVDQEQRQMALRVSLTTQLILQQESHLSQVNDPANGSFAIENLTQALIEKSWSLMQVWSDLTPDELVSEVKMACEKNWSEVKKDYQRRKLVQTGVNDFALVSQQVKLHPRWIQSDHVRLAQDFETLRLKLKTKPQVLLMVVGDYAQLQARLNFSRNYFEVLGLEVIEVVAPDLASLPSMGKFSISVWVTADELHSQLTAKTARCYIAGKSTVPGCLNIFSGQNIFETLKELVTWWEQ
jgi:hypothetical protein